jgi:hypothetical protein
MPARSRRKVSDDRVRFLNQCTRLHTDLDYLKPLGTEEARLREVIESDYPEHAEEFVIPLNTVMRGRELIG